MEHEGDRRESGAGDDGAGAVFELGERLGELGAGGVAAPRVVVGARAAQALEGESRREVDGGNDSAVGAVGGDGGADGAGLGATVEARDSRGHVRFIVVV
jgi:hypothetical protein